MTQGNNPQHPQQDPYRQSYGQPEQGGWGQPGYDPAASPQAGYQQGGYAKPGAQGGYDASGYQQGGYPQPGYQQQAYPQQGYPQQGYPQQAYQAPGYPAAQPGYGQAMPYGQVEQPRSPLLGMMSLGVVVICTVLFGWVMFRMGALLAPVLVTSAGAATQQQMADELLQRLGGTGVLLLNVSTYGGIAAWIAGIVATATKRGRSYGIWAIIIGVLAPFIGFGLMLAALMPYINA